MKFAQLGINDGDKVERGELVKKNRIIFSCAAIAVVITVAIILYSTEANKPSQYVVYSQFYSKELQTSLVERLQSNDISYQIDDEGNVLIPEREVTRAVQCCS